MYLLVRYGEFVALFDEYPNNLVDLSNNYALLEQEEDVVSLAVPVWIIVVCFKDASCE